MQRKKRSQRIYKCIRPVCSHISEYTKTHTYISLKKKTHIYWHDEILFYFWFFIWRLEIEYRSTKLRTTSRDGSHDRKPQKPSSSSPALSPTTASAVTELARALLRLTHPSAATPPPAYSICPTLIIGLPATTLSWCPHCQPHPNVVSDCPSGRHHCRPTQPSS